jgi:L-fucose isomerase-like protein
LVELTRFSGGFLAPVLAKIKNAYLGLWAIPEGAQEGAVPLNSFCSVNMYASIIGHYLKEYNIPFKWFYGNAGHELFDRRFEITIRALTAIKNIKNSKVALIGGVAPGFNDLYFDERSIMKTFNGLKINRLHEFSEIKDRALSYKTEEVSAIAQKMVAESKGVHPKSQTLLETNARMYKAYKDFLKDYAYDGLAISCWPKFQSDFRFSVCSVIANLNDDGIIAACEGDLPSAVSMLLLKYLAKDETMLMDFSDFDETDETILMWHCGPASKRFCGDKGFTLGVNYHGLAHEKGKELSCCGIVRDMVFKPGPVTIARITGEGNKFFLAEGDFIDYEKKSFLGSRGWMGNLKFNREKISVRDFVNTVLVQRFQHHYPIVNGDFSKEIMEITAWLKMDLVNKVLYQEYMQNGEV